MARSFCAGARTRHRSSAPSTRWKPAAKDSSSCYCKGSRTPYSILLVAEQELFAVDQHPGQIFESGAAFLRLAEVREPGLLLLRARGAAQGGEVHLFQHLFVCRGRGGELGDFALVGAQLAVDVPVGEQL